MSVALGGATLNNRLKTRNLNTHKNPKTARVTVSRSAVASVWLKWWAMLIWRATSAAATDRRTPPTETAQNGRTSRRQCDGPVFSQTQLRLR